MTATLRERRYSECRFPIKRPLNSQQFQPETNIELAAGMRAATGKTCDCAFEFLYAGEIAPAIRATIDETRRITFRRKWQCMTTLFPGDSQIATSLLPFGSVGGNPPPFFFPKLREDMGEFVSQRAIDFPGMLDQTRV